MSVTAASIFYGLFIVVFTKDGPATVDKLYGTQFDCQVAEGVMLTKARDMKDVIGWKVVSECEPVVENNKV